MVQPVCADAARFWLGGYEKHSPHYEVLWVYSRLINVRILISPCAQESDSYSVILTFMAWSDLWHLLLKKAAASRCGNGWLTVVSLPAPLSDRTAGIDGPVWFSWHRGRGTTALISMLCCAPFSFYLRVHTGAALCFIEHPLLTNLLLCFAAMMYSFEVTSSR